MCMRMYYERMTEPPHAQIRAALITLAARATRRSGMKPRVTTAVVEAVPFTDERGQDTRDSGERRGHHGPRQGLRVGLTPTLARFLCFVFEDRAFCTARQQRVINVVSAHDLYQ